MDKSPSLHIESHIVNQLVGHDTICERCCSNRVMFRILSGRIISPFETGSANCLCWCLSNRVANHADSEIKLSRQSAIIISNQSFKHDYAMIHSLQCVTFCHFVIL